MKIKIYVCIVFVVFMQGCTSTIPIKKQTSSVKEVAKCIADENSHGQCGVRQAFLNAEIPIRKSDYFDALSSMNIPDNISKTQIANFNVEEKSKLSNYITMFSQLNCDGSYSKEAADLAKNSLSSASNKSIHQLYSMQLSGKNISENENPAIKINSNEFNSFLEQLYEADAYGGLHYLQCVAIVSMSNSSNQSEIDAMAYLFDELSYTKEYLKAYFRQGQFLQGKIKTSDLYKKLEDKLKSEAPSFFSDEQIKDLARSLFKRLTGKNYEDACKAGGSCEIAFAGKLDPIQFVTRAGVEYGFPHITVTVDPLAEKKFAVTEIDWNIIGSQVAKVYMEAVGDKLIGLPADPRSTACKINSALCYYEQQDGEISSDNFALVGEHADKVDTLVSTAVGKSIRGAGWVSLNNEAIASIIESAVGTVAKKAAEKVAYCTFSCGNKDTNGVPLSVLQGDVKVEITR